MFICVKGSTISNREMAEDIGYFSLSILAPRLRNSNKLEVDISLIKNLKEKEDVVGDCVWEDSSYMPRHFTIRIDSSQSKHDMLQTVAHEMVHVKQFARGELKDTDSLSICKWNGKDINHMKTHYYDCPWEIEAHGRERGIFIRWVEQSKWKNCKWAKY